MTWLTSWWSGSPTSSSSSSPSGSPVTSSSTVATPLPSSTWTHPDGSRIKRLSPDGILVKKRLPISEELSKLSTPFPPPNHPLIAAKTFPYNNTTSYNITTSTHDPSHQDAIAKFGEVPKLGVEHTPKRSHIPLPSEEYLNTFPSPFKDEPDFCTSPPLQWAHGWPVEECVDKFFNKYPDPAIPEFVKAEIVKDEYDQVNQIRRIQRIITVRNIAPWIFRKFVGGDYLQLEENGEWDEKRRTFSMYSFNRSFSSCGTMAETSQFQPHPDNPKEWTHFIQYGGVRCSHYFGYLKRPLEQIICRRLILGGIQAAERLDQKLRETVGPEW